MKTDIVKALLSEARNYALSELEQSPGANYNIQTVIKPIAGVKKRPKK